MIRTTIQQQSIVYDASDLNKPNFSEALTALLL